MLALILSCGGSSEPLEYCIENMKPDLVYFLCSKDSLDIADAIEKKYNSIANQFNVKVVENYESLEDSFAKSREIIQELKRDYTNIHVDFTGGTKPMVSGLVLAAIGEKCTYSYVGSDELKGRDKNGLGVVQSGFETIIEQRDPYDVFAVVEFDKGMDFFNKYQFTASRENFTQAHEKLESEKLKKICEIYLKLVDLYDLWDKFNNTDSEKNTLNSILSSIISEINQSCEIKNYFKDNSPEFLAQINENLEFLKLKISKRGIKTGDVKYYLPDLLNNAYRRIEEGKYDDAVARLYRSIELTAQLGLVNEGVVDVNVLKSNAVFKINKQDLNSKYNVDVDMLVRDWREYSEGDKTFKIPLKKSFELLQALGSDYATQYLEDKKIKTNISSRNNSILAHGLDAIDKDLAVTLYNQVFAYAKMVFPEIGTYYKMSKFPKFG